MKGPTVSALPEHAVHAIPAPRSQLMASVTQMLAAGGDPRAAAWKRVDESLVCQRCDGPVALWWTPDWSWRTAVLTTTFQTLCPVCFIALAERAGVGLTGAWQIYPPAALY